MKHLLLKTLLLLLIAGCSTDELSAPSIELKKRLSTYTKTRVAAPVHSWVSSYHGEASGHQMMITLVEWGNLNRVEMNSLLESWPLSDRNEVIDRLVFAASDSGQKILFTISKSAQHGA
jgi:hypothetical protein